jgi:hypothetical protein
MEWKKKGKEVNFKYVDVDVKDKEKAQVSVENEVKAN